MEKVSKFTQTRLGYFPDDWKIKKLEDIASITMGQSPKSDKYNENNEGLPLIQGNADCENRYTKPRLWTTQITKTCNIGDIIMTVRAPVGYVSKSLHYACIGRGVCSIKAKENQDYLYYYLINYEGKWKRISQGSTFESINSDDIKKLDVILPPSIEQQKIASILSTWDKAIELKEKLIEQKKKQKKGLMQKLLTGEVRLPGEKGEWKNVRLEDISACLDNKRKPLNSIEREKMKGDIPYYGANGIVDYVNDYLFNEPLILLAEDGGHFNEFSEKAIAMKIEGKAWVNNHAHILKITNSDTDFVFYSLVHKDIRKYINGSTRGKLTQSDMLTIELAVPVSIEEQKAISQILNTISRGIDLINEEINQLKLQKQGLMQLLLTGKVRVQV